MTIARIKAVTLGLTLASLAGFPTPTLRAADAAEVKYQPFTISLEAGTLGFGGSVNWRFSDHFGVRGGINYLSYSSSEDEFANTQIPIVNPASYLATGEILGYAAIDTKMRLISAPIGVDIYPWQKSSFRVTVGILVNQNESTGVSPAAPNVGTTLLINNQFYDSASVGGLSMKVEQAPISPYLSVGASYYFDKAKHWSVSGELGVAYTGNPDVTVATGNANTVNPADLNALAHEIEDGVWKFYPILKMGLNFSF